MRFNFAPKPPFNDARAKGGKFSLVINQTVTSG